MESDYSIELSANDIRQAKRAILTICSCGEYLSVDIIFQRLNDPNIPLSKLIIEECIAQLVKEGELKKSDTEEKWAATTKAHGVYQVKSRQEGGVAFTSARLSPEALDTLHEIIQDLKATPQKD